MGKTLTLIGWLLAAMIGITIMVFAFTDVWPYMHEVIWQQSWKPVCPGPHGEVVFC